MGDPVCLCCLDEQMAYHALSELKPGVKNWNVCVHVSHLWEYRGGTDTGPVQHVDMVLVNNKGNAMYAEIGKDDLEHKAPLLADGNTYTLTRFMVSLATLLWKQWLTSKMAFWSSCTTLFRFWTSQPMWERTSALYCWVIVSVSAAAFLCIARQPTLTTKRTIVLEDHFYFIFSVLEVYIWFKLQTY
ncbi:uncharacterized protein [Aegilops tauschii subsp. strangulata]|uniref:uncharacterized protein n=2 Tax=Triticinae TaxID=1648030 RepID=UPI003CC842F5